MCIAWLPVFSRLGWLQVSSGSTLAAALLHTKTTQSRARILLFLHASHKLGRCLAPSPKLEQMSWRVRDGQAINAASCRTQNMLLAPTCSYKELHVGTAPDNDKGFPNKRGR